MSLVCSLFLSCLRFCLHRQQYSHTSIILKPKKYVPDKNVKKEALYCMRCIVEMQSFLIDAIVLSAY